MVKISLIEYSLAFVSFSFCISECYRSSSSSYSYHFVRRKYYNSLEEEGNRWLCLVLGFCSTVFPPVYTERPGLVPVYQWRQLEFDYPTARDRQSDVTSRIFIPGKPAPIDVDVHYGSNNVNRIFVTVPRFQEGVPVTLGVVTDRKLNGNPIIAPYPSWQWHRNPEQCKPNRLVSVYRVQIDECGRLWVLDTGKLLEEQRCPPQILAFDLATNELIYKYEIPSSQLESRSILVTPIVDVRDAHLKCRDTFVYVADCQTYSIIVYDLKRETSWQITDKTMYPYPNYGTFNIRGDSFDLMDGILGMALSPYKPGQDRKLYYHAMSSPTENWVYTSDIRNQTRFIHDPTSSPEIFHTYRGERRTQSAAEAMDKDGVMYFGLMSDITIDCWNTETEYGSKTMEPVASNPETLQFASGIKVVTNQRAAEELWVMTSRFQKIGADTLNPSEVNFRIQAGKVDDLKFGTKCSGRRATRPGGGYGLLKPVLAEQQNVAAKPVNKNKY